MVWHHNVSCNTCIINTKYRQGCIRLSESQKLLWHNEAQKNLSKGYLITCYQSMSIWAFCCLLPAKLERVQLELVRIRVCILWVDNNIARVELKICNCSFQTGCICVYKTLKTITRQRSYNQWSFSPIIEFLHSSREVPTQTSVSCASIIQLKGYQKHV